MEIAKPDSLGLQNLSNRLDGLAGMAWAFSVLSHSGMSPRAAGIYFTPPVYLKKDQHGDPVDSGVFRYYLNGKRKPIAGPRGKNGVDLVAIVGNEPYGSQVNLWLDHPLLNIFVRDVAPEYLASFCAVEKIPVHIIPSLFTKDFSDINWDAAPKVRRLSDFLYVCAFYKMLHTDGYASTVAPLIRYLVPQVCKLEPAFNFIHAPFVKMLEDYYFKTDEYVVEARSVDYPPCFDSEFSDPVITDGPCLLIEQGKAEDVCIRCQSSNR